MTGYAQAVASRTELGGTRIQDQSRRTSFSREQIAGKGVKANAAETAVLSSWGNQAALADIQPDIAKSNEQTASYEDFSTAPEESEAESLGFLGKVDRFFSRKINFDVDGTKLVGKNGHQVRGGKIQLLSGGVLDLAPADLIGGIEKPLQYAKGSGAKLLLASGRMKILQEACLDTIYLDSDKNIFGQADQKLEFNVDDLGAYSVQGVTVDQKDGGTPKITLEKLSWKGLDGSQSDVQNLDLQDQFELPIPSTPDQEQNVMLEPTAPQGISEEPKALDSLLIAGRPTTWQHVTPKEDGGYSFTGAQVTSKLFAGGAESVTQWGSGETEPKDGAQKLKEPPLPASTQTIHDYNDTFSSNSPMLSITNGGSIEILDSVYFSTQSPIAPQSNAPQETKIKFLLSTDSKPNIQFVGSALDVTIAKNAATLQGRLSYRENEGLGFQSATIKVEGFNPLNLQGSHILSEDGEIFGLKAGESLNVVGEQSAKDSTDQGGGALDEIKSQIIEAVTGDIVDLSKSLHLPISLDIPDSSQQEESEEVLIKPGDSLQSDEASNSASPINPNETTNIDKTVIFETQQPLWLGKDESSETELNPALKLHAKGKIQLQEQPFKFVPTMSFWAHAGLEDTDIGGAELSDGKICETELEPDVTVDFVNGFIQSAQLPDFDTSYEMDDEDIHGIVSFEGAKIENGHFVAETMDVLHEKCDAQTDEEDEANELHEEFFPAEDDSSESGDEEENTPVSMIKAAYDAASWTQREIYTNVSFPTFAPPPATTSSGEAAQPTAAAESSAPKTADSASVTDTAVESSLANTQTAVSSMPTARYGKGDFKIEPIDGLTGIYNADHGRLSAEYEKNTGDLLGNAKFNVPIPIFPPLSAFIGGGFSLNFGAYSKISADWGKKDSLDLAAEAKLSASLGGQLTAGIGISAGIGSLRAQLALAANANAALNLDAAMNLNKTLLSDSTSSIKLNEVSMHGDLELDIGLSAKIQAAASFLIWDKVLFSYTLAEWKSPPLELGAVDIKRSSDGKWTFNLSSDLIGKKFAEQNKEALSDKLTADKNELGADYEMAAKNMEDSAANIAACADSVQIIADEVTKIRTEYEELLQKTIAREEELKILHSVRMAKTDKDYIDAQNERNIHAYREAKLRQYDQTDNEDTGELDSKGLYRQTVKEANNKVGRKGRTYSDMFKSGNVQSGDISEVQKQFYDHNSARIRYYLEEINSVFNSANIASPVAELMNAGDDTLIDDWKSQSQSNPMLSEPDEKSGLGYLDCIDLKKAIKMVNKHVARDDEMKRADLSALNSTAKGSVGRNVITSGLRKSIRNQDVEPEVLRKFEERSLAESESKRESLWRRDYETLFIAMDKTQEYKKANETILKNADDVLSYVSTASSGLADDPVLRVKLATLFREKTTEKMSEVENEKEKTETQKKSVEAAINATNLELEKLDTTVGSD